MLKYNKITSQIKLNKISQGELAEKVGMPREGFSRMLKAKTMKVETLEIIASALGVSESFFFQQDYPTNDQSSLVSENNPKSIENMKKLIDAQSEIISMQKEKISDLKSRLAAFENDNAISSSRNG